MRSFLRDRFGVDSLIGRVLIDLKAYRSINQLGDSARALPSARVLSRV